jgi:predicted protein tyrosine phosphatase
LEPLSIIILSRKGASQYLVSDRGIDVRSLLSIGDPGEPPPLGFERPDHVLRLEFHDTVLVSDHYGPKAEDVARIIAFAPDVARAGGTCVVHCAAGISRSTASGIVLLSAMLGPGQERRAANEVLALVPDAIPNTLIIRHADRLMSREGKLRDAVESTFPSLPFWVM